ncbi:hypothetical protein ACFVRB_12960 [Streptomyces nojiriensis]|uniref:hypothetical protein n=1 Tax=Streptomyces nojiriensis TaxID=66374 RepID=UPI0036DBD9C0
MPDAEADAELAEGLSELVAGYRCDASSVVQANISQLPDQFPAMLLMSGFVMTAFLVGLHGGERRLLADTGNHRARMRRILVLGAAVGLPGGLFMTMAVIGPLGPRWQPSGRWWERSQPLHSLPRTSAGCSCS